LRLRDSGDLIRKAATTPTLVEFVPRWDLVIAIWDLIVICELGFGISGGDFYNQQTHAIAALIDRL
jgi:hypothetical protein